MPLLPKLLLLLQPELTLLVFLVGTTRLATLPSDLLDDHAPAFVPGWMAQDKVDKPTPAAHKQVRADMCRKS